MVDHSTSKYLSDSATKLPPMIADWYHLRYKYEWSRGRFFQRFELDRASPLVMDALWADGWRHFGSHFFRDIYNLEGNRLVKVIPLRIVTSVASLPKDHRRIVNKNSDLDVTFKKISFSEEHHRLFELHAQRFRKNQPDDLYQFLSTQAHIIPCPSQMCEVRDQNKQLLAVSFIDIGMQSISSIYAMFLPEESSRGLGIYTLLMELSHARTLGKNYLYTGYAHTQNSYYDYKKRFHGTEFYDWQGTWRPLEQLQHTTFPQHKFEHEDIPSELLVSADEET